MSQKKYEAVCIRCGSSRIHFESDGYDLTCRPCAVCKAPAVVIREFERYRPITRRELELK